MAHPAAGSHARLEIADQFVFDGAGGTAFVMSLRTSRPGFRPGIRYEFRVHPGASTVEQLTFRLAFGAVDGGRQPLTLRRLEGSDASRDTAPGTLVARGRTGTAVDGAGLRLWAGRAVDPCPLDRAALRRVAAAVQRDEDLDPSARPGPVTARPADVIVLDVPLTDATLCAGRDIRVWSTTRAPAGDGGWRQASRCGLPLVGPIFRAEGGPLAARAARTHPSRDVAEHRRAIEYLVAGVAGRLGTARPDAHAAAVARRLTPDLLPFRIGSPAVFGFAGINGRCLGDNAAEVMYALVTNRAVPTGRAPTSTAAFPYAVPIG